MHHTPASFLSNEREFFIDNLLVRNHFIIVIIRWTGQVMHHMTVFRFFTE